MRDSITFVKTYHPHLTGTYMALMFGVTRTLPMCLKRKHDMNNMKPSSLRPKKNLNEKG